MTTPVAMPVIVILMQFYPGAGTAVPVPRQSNTSVMSTYFTMEDCNRDRYTRGHGEDFFCVEFRSEKIIDYTFPGDKQRQGSNDDSAVGPPDGTVVGPLALKAADKPYIEPLVEPKPLDIMPKAAEQAPKPKRVAQQPRQEQQAMLNGNPFSGLFNW
jgi:hypothetical protein